MTEEEFINDIAGHYDFNWIKHLGLRLTGLTLAEATYVLTSLKISFRIVSVDGKACIVTKDFNPERINLGVDGDIITSVYLG